MDGLILDVPTPEHVAPFVWPVCLSPMTAQYLVIAIVVLLGAMLHERLWPAKRPRR